jgi:hypothetical protein
MIKFRLESNAIHMPLVLFFKVISLILREIELIIFYKESKSSFIP